MAPAKSPVAAEHRAMLTLLRAHWVSMMVSVFLLGLATVLTLLQPRLAGRLVDLAAAGSSILTLAILLLIMLVGQPLEWLGHFQLERIGEQIVLRLRAVFTNHVVRLPIGLLDRGRTGDLLARGTSDASLVRDMPRAVVDIVFGMLTFVGVSVFMLTIDPVTVGVVVAVMAVAFVAVRSVSVADPTRPLNRQVALGDHTAALDRALGAARTVKLYGAEDREVTSISSSAHAAGVSASASRFPSPSSNPLCVWAPPVISGDHDHRWEPRRKRWPNRWPVRQPVRLRRIRGLSRHRWLYRTHQTAHRGRHVSTPHRHSAGSTGRRPPSLAVAGTGVTTPCAPQADQNTAPLVEFDHVSFSYGENPVLDDVCFTLGQIRSPR